MSPKSFPKIILLILGLPGAQQGWSTPILSPPSLPRGAQQNQGAQSFSPALRAKHGGEKAPSPGAASRDCGRAAFPWELLIELQKPNGGAAPCPLPGCLHKRKWQPRPRCCHPALEPEGRTLLGQRRCQDGGRGWHQRGELSHSSPSILGAATGTKGGQQLGGATSEALLWKSFIPDARSPAPQSPSPKSCSQGGGGARHPAVPQPRAAHGGCIKILI